jgi:hypothetical protein
MQAVVAMLLALYFVVRAVQERRILDWLLAGFAIGLGTEVYYAGRLAPIVVAVYLGSRIARERGFFRSHAAGLAVLVLGTVIFLAPMAAVYARGSGGFLARTNGVLVTVPSNLEHELDAYHMSTIPQVVGIQAVHTLEAFNIRGETSLQYGHPTPLLDQWTGALLAVSALAILLRPGSSRGVLLAAWVWLALLIGSVLTVDALFSPRVLVVLPALVMGPALLLERAWQAISYLSGRVGTYIGAAAVSVILVLAFRANIHDYFDVQVVDRQPANQFTRLADYSATIADSYRLVAIGTDSWSLQSEAPRFLVPQADATNIRNQPLRLPLDVIPPTRGVAFLVENQAPDYTQRMDAIRQAYPEGREEIIRDSRGGNPIFASYLVQNADLVKANPAAVRN